MERQQVRSAILRSVGYDESTKILEVEFQNNQVFRFSAVPKKIYGDLMNAGAMGKYFSEKIRPKYQARQVLA